MVQSWHTYIGGCKSSHQNHLPCEKNQDIEESLTKLLNSDEDLSNESSLTSEEHYAVDKFKEIIRRQPDGRYTVQPIFKKMLYLWETIISLLI